MKVRVCPKCGKHNEETSFSCVDCGTTLSMKTLMDTDSGQLLNEKPIAGYIELSNISPYFEQDTTDVINKFSLEKEKIIWGCNTTHLVQAVSLLITTVSSSAFLFGYLIITNKQLVCVYFESDLTNGKPKRPCLDIWRSRAPLGGKPSLAVAQPGYDLSPNEKSSRQIKTYSLSDMTSISLESKGITENSLARLIIKLKQGSEASVTFYGMDKAEKLQKLIGSKLTK